MTDHEETDFEIEQWKLRRLMKQLDAARGSGTSAITLTVAAGRDISLTRKMLDEELGTAQCIKTRTNRLSVLSAITSCKQRCLRYARTPPNGLIIFCGEMAIEGGRDKKITIEFEPQKPMVHSSYICDSQFHTEVLSYMLEGDEKFGFLIVDGSGALFGTVQGSHREVLHKFTVDLPKKHSKGGQSAMRFARLRLEKRHNYIRKVGELATQHFIEHDKANIKGLIVAGSAEFKHALTTNSDLFDRRLAAVLTGPLLDIQYGGEMGFNQAIEMSSTTLKDVKLIQERKQISKFMEEIALDSGLVCFGIDDVMTALDMCAVDTLLVWENTDLIRMVLRDPRSEEEFVHFIPSDNEFDADLYRCKDQDTELERVGSEPFLDWILPIYKSKYSTKLQVVTDRSQEGHQFCKGFGGLGCLLRYPVEFEHMREPSVSSDIESDEDFM